MTGDGAQGEPLAALTPRPLAPDLLPLNLQVVEVAVAVLIRGDGCVLLAQRPPGKVYAGYWEFPGGKIEPGESVESALAREIREELSIEIACAYPWVTQVFTYPHATVRLNFFRVTAWQGEVRVHEHQDAAWQHPESVSVVPLLPANGAVLKGLQLPCEYAISQALELGAEEFLARLQRRLAGGLRMIQVREIGAPRELLASLSERVIALARPRGARVLVNGDIELARQVGADGVHLSAKQVASAKRRPDLPWCGASCHSPEELRAAERLAVDFAVLGPVRSTPSHPDSVPLGWRRFGGIARGASIPIFALGGVVPADLEVARRCGGHGVSMVRGAWRES